VFGGKDHHHNAAPIGNGVSEERADVVFLIADAVKHNPGQKNETCHNGKTMSFKERLVLFLAQRKFQNVTSIQPWKQSLQIITCNLDWKAVAGVA
jgi:hypothetical protein